MRAAVLLTTSWLSGDAGDRECAAALWAAVQRLTREQLAYGLLQLLADLEQQANQLAPQLLGGKKIYNQK